MNIPSATDGAGLSCLWLFSARNVRISWRSARLTAPLQNCRKRGKIPGAPEIILRAGWLS
jgi:hypothetical protein